MKVTWEVDDYYVGPSRPQHTTIESEAFNDCKNEEDRQKVIDERIQEDLNNLGINITSVSTKPNF